MSNVQKLAMGSATGLLLLAALLGCGTGNNPGPPDGSVQGCATACTLQLSGDSDADDATELPGGGPESFNCDDAPIATYVSASGGGVSGFNFSIGRSGSPDLSINLFLSTLPSAGTAYAGVTTEVAYLATGNSQGPAYLSDPALGGSSTFVFCTVEAGQTFGPSTSYTVHGTVDAVLVQSQPPMNEAAGTLNLHAQF